MKGWPDYITVTGLVENYDEYGQNYPVGIGDGAARLGSIKTYDMRGRVYWMDDFEAPTLHWTTANGGVGGSQAIVSDYVRNGEQSLGLTANTGGGRISTAQRHLALPRQRKIGTEIHISAENGFDIAKIELFLDDGTTRYRAAIRIDEGAGQLLYIDNNGIFQDSGIDMGLRGDIGHFHALKFVLDYDTQNWMRIMWDDQEIDLSGIGIRQMITTGSRYMELYLSNQGNNVVNARMCFDDCIMTTMEPE